VTTDRHQSKVGGKKRVTFIPDGWELTNRLQRFSTWRITSVVMKKKKERVLKMAGDLKERLHLLCREGIYSGGEGGGSKSMFRRQVRACVKETQG